MTVYKFRFDYDVGYLVKSPCRECENRKDFPGCIEKCEMLDKIQSLLAKIRSSAKG